MTEESQFILETAAEGMEKSLEHLEREYQKIRAGKANPIMLSGVLVEYYGALVPLEQTATIHAPDPRQLIVQPFDKSSINNLDKAIRNANLGFNPANDGDILRIQVPPLSEERRRDLVKRAKSESENTKVGIRNVRRQANEEVKQLEKDGAPEDEMKRVMEKIQQLTDEYIKKVDHLLELKEKDILTV
ncbi:MAG: ribosome recycling factor [Bacteroidales bacterium]|jgi:ribosome recycling factor|nr:ribosome recycling factor [Bacteroidales bacterium]MDY0368431.1 ribosome recycling factor [Bacteroidales bacterium]